MTIGDGHTCALTMSGRAYCWGENDFGQVGDGSKVDRAVPVPVAGSLRFRELSAGAYHTCGIALADVVYCWGDNRWGQLGSGDVPYNSVAAARDIPVAVVGQIQWASVAAGWQHTCAIASSGVAHCWGRNEDAKQLGDESGVTHRGIPGPVADAPSFAAITAGPLATCGRTTLGDTWCWGGNYYGGLGDGTVSQGVARPTRVKGGPFIEITLGQAHSCALGHDRELWCWGDKSAGQY
jgi:alpha-tubulin suppressor-like RCC1 family protein